ncbi:unnamed protein product [Linum trigynum]|uniref:Uncharacterized protein n=1 Tax=Linum trigynum TaxID=586398 RepID=A0AAV2FR31_9ROSI
MNFTRHTLYFSFVYKVNSLAYSTTCLPPISGGGGNHSAAGVKQLALDVTFPCEDVTAKVHYDAFEASIL